MLSWRYCRPPCGGADRNRSRIHPYRFFQRSPPVRGRGSKLKPPDDSEGLLASPPVRGRGSKRPGTAGLISRVRSPPVRGRGSKQARSQDADGGRRRPPCGGADRNTGCVAVAAYTYVAPRAGARIETLAGVTRRNPKASPPVRGRGSKPAAGPTAHRIGPRRPPCGGADRNTVLLLCETFPPVAPRAGARIETQNPG